MAAAVVIIVTGGVVRVTGWGLGCPQWPSCTGGRLAPTAEMGVHGVIEFGNRLLTGALCLVVGWLVIAARLQREPSRAVLRGAWAQFWVIVLNAVVGGVTVWMRLSPYIVAAHFLAATLLLTAAASPGTVCKGWSTTRPYRPSCRNAPSRWAGGCRPARPCRSWSAPRPPVPDRTRVTPPT
ncbi:COX15/CtaA family protein [Streptomyces minutiscleroticus]|uniref:COX15/CtaA family protein n=1 Tax=Streptomyces minutiscleroticus TaxID=68238 RepID=UPI00333352D6